MTRGTLHLDDPEEDLYYIKRRLEKFLIKLKYWRSLRDLNEGEVTDIVDYYSRLDAFRTEVNSQLYNRDGSAEDYNDGSERTAIYTFYKQLPSMRESNPKIDKLCIEVERLLQVVELEFTERTDFRQRLINNRGKLAPGEDHRSHQHRAKKNGVQLKRRKEIAIGVDLLEEIEASAAHQGLNFSDWIRNAAKLKLYIDRRKMGRAI